MKKNIIISVLFVSFAFITNAQTGTPKDSLMKQMSKEVCEEMSKGDTTAPQSMDELQMKLSQAFAPLLSKYMDQLQALNIDISSPEEMESLGREIGIRLVASCPMFYKFLSTNSGALKQFSKERSAPAKSTVNGVLLKIVPGDFSYLQVKTKANKIEKIWWMEYFEGSNVLTEKPASLLNKNVTITYVEKEIYNSTLKDYVKVKVAVAIE
ncbi:MAG: hypothetical protein ABJA78_03510 [Ferruginibacter sp.]